MNDATSPCEKPDPHCLIHHGGPHTCWVTVEYIRDPGGVADPGVALLGVALVALLPLVLLW